MIKNLIICSLCCLFLSASVKGLDDSLSVDDYRYQISLEQIDIPLYKNVDTLHLLLNAPGVPLGGFDFKFQFTSSLFEITEVNAGQFVDECEWEFFKAINLNEKSEKIVNGSVWQVIALADMIADTVQPFCFSASDNKAILAEIIIQKKLMATGREDTAPMYFYWEDCSDNSISGKSGNELYLSKKVIEYLPDSLLSRNNQFPTTQGTPQNCFRPGGLNSPRRSIEFHHGGVRIDFSDIEETISDK